MAIPVRLPAGRALSIFMFILRAYDLEDEKLDVIERTLQASNLTFPQLHKVFSKAFFKGFCTK